VYWSDQSGANVVADIEVGTPGTQANGRYVSVAGRFSARGLTKLPLHFPATLRRSSTTSPWPPSEGPRALGKGS
jgi:hypothetical protein